MSETEQCRAVTESGDRCTRPAGDDGFCYQHGPDDETIDEASEDGDNGMTDDESADDEEADATDEGERAEADEAGAESDDEPEAELDVGASEGEFDVMDVRETVTSIADDLIGHPLDGIIEITPEEDGWRVLVEVVERSSVPDTQDILGQYAVTLDGSGGVKSYRLRERYRRGDEQEQM